MKLHVFYNGTDSNFDKDFKKEGRFIHGEIVSRFGYYAQAETNNRDKTLRINGVGGSKDNTNKAVSTLGTLFGVKMREDVAQIVAFVIKHRSALIAKNKKANPSAQDKTLVVTLMGWSRGGIGCIYAAHMLSKIWDEYEKSSPSNVVLSIKIIAFDPVSGLGTNMRAINIGWRDMASLLCSVVLSTLDQKIMDIAVQNLEKTYQSIENWWELPEQVSEYHGFYAHDERSSGFATTIPAMVGNIKDRSFHIYSVPGTHSTLVGNLYPNGGSTPATDNTASPVGLLIYRCMVKKIMDLMTNWGCEFDHSIDSDWLAPLYLDSEVNPLVITGEALAQYKKQAQLVAIISKHLNPMNQHSAPGITDGRGVYLGGNKQDRKWKPTSTLSEFMNEDNSKSILDSLYSYVNGHQTKLEKLGGNVKVHDFALAGFSWN